MTYLLDVSSLIAAIWQDHPDHAKVDLWIPGKSLATCPISELGFLRISTHPKAINAPVGNARSLLDRFLRSQHCAFVPDDMPALECRSSRSESTTDLYLAELASKHAMKLAALDQRIAHPTVEVIG